MNVAKEILINEIAHQISKQSDFSAEILKENHSLLQRESTQFPIDWQKAQANTGYKQIQKWYKDEFQKKIFDQRRYKTSSFIERQIHQKPVSLSISGQQIFPAENVQSGTFFSYNEQLYSFGGFTTKYINKTQLFLNQKFQTIDIKYDTPLRAFSTVSYKGQPYFFGGEYQGQARNKLFTFQDEFLPISTNSGPLPRYGHGAAVIGDKMYIFGGKAPGKLFNDFWAFDFKLETWSKFNVITPQRRCFCAFFSYQNTLMLVGGRSEVTELSDIWQFDLETESWEKLGDTANLSGINGVEIQNQIVITSLTGVFQLSLEDKKLRRLCEIESSQSSCQLVHGDQLYIYNGYLQIIDFACSEEVEMDRIEDISLIQLDEQIQADKEMVKSQKRSCSVQYIKMEKTPQETKKQVSSMQKYDESAYDRVTFEEVQTPGNTHKKQDSQVLGAFLEFSQEINNVIQQILNQLEDQKLINRYLLKRLREQE